MLPRFTSFRLAANSELSNSSLGCLRLFGINSFPEVKRQAGPERLDSNQPSTILAGESKALSKTYLPPNTQNARSDVQEHAAFERRGMKRQTSVTLSSIVVSIFPIIPI